MALRLYRMGAIYYKICIDSYEIYLLECFTSPLSASKYNAHTEPLFKNLKLLKIEHTLTLHELKLYYKFIHIRLPVYLQNLELDQNSSIHNINTRGQHNIHT